MQYTLKDRLLNAVVPAMLITLPIGSVYAFSNFSKDIADCIGCTLPEIQFAFTLSILFLGLGAAFFGPVIERNVRLSGTIAAVLFACGMLVTAAGVNLKSIRLVYLGYGVLNGCAQGCGYVTPVKTMILWHPRNKGLASAISIISFGLGSSLCVYLAGLLMPVAGIRWIFAWYAAIYAAMMGLGAAMLRKPAEFRGAGAAAEPFSYRGLFRNATFWQAWTFMFLNICCGLVLIGSTRNIFAEVVSGEAVITTLLMLCGLFNGGFRLVFAWWSDFLKNRIDIWMIISAISVALMIASSAWFAFVTVAILLINATYGAGFSTLPSILSDVYGNSSLSRIHGATLSAWGIASLPAYVISRFLLKNVSGFTPVLAALCAIYALNAVNVFILKKRLASR